MADPAAAPANGRYRLAAMGDVMMDRDVGRHFAEAPDDFRMDDVREVLRRFDLVCLNLENPVSTRGQPDAIQDPHVTFRARPETLSVLRDLGVNLVSLGNNHMLDYGEPALADTLEQLDAAGIRWVGAGRNYEEANRPLLLTCNGQQVAFLSYPFIYSANTRMAGRNRGGVSDHRASRVLPRIRELRIAGYDVIVLLHWGAEYSFYPVPYQMRQARRMIDEGASLVLGHGPHYPQGIEDYRDGRIVYSLGNFIFDEPHKFANRSFIYGTTLNGGGQPLAPGEIYPLHLNRHVPTLVPGDRKARLERLVANLGAAYQRRDTRFWQDVSDAYLMDVCGRVLRNRSLKYFAVPSLSFYRDVRLTSVARKLKPANLLELARALGRRAYTGLRSVTRSAIPLRVRVPLAVWLKRQAWIRRREYLASGLVGDLRIRDPKAFHKLLWAHHFMDYARWYDAESELFAAEQMQPSRREFFHDLQTVLRAGGVRTGEIRSVLEVGCSQGYLLRHLETDVFPECPELVGVDIDREAVHKGRAYLAPLGSRVSLLVGDMEDLERVLGRRSFDVVFAAGVLSYLDERDAGRLVAWLLATSRRVLALAGLASTSRNNNELPHSELSPHHEGQWIHNFEAMVRAAGGRVVKSRWEGAKLYNFQTICFVFAVPA